MRSLYISYDGLKEALVQSQVIPYLKGLSEDGIIFTLLTFDKRGRTDEIKKIMLGLKNERIECISLRYHKKPTLPATLYDIMQGVLVSTFLVMRNKVDVIHARSYVAAAIALVLKKLLKIKLIFDMRGIWPDEKVDANTWPRGGFLYKVTKAFEKRLLLNADAIIVLTEKLKTIVEDFEYMKGHKVAIDVIPACVDVNKFKIAGKPQDLVESLRLGNKTIFIYSGSLGTWYMLDEMVDFFKIAKAKIINAHFLFFTLFRKSVIDNLMFNKGVDKDEFSVISAPHEEMPRWLSIGDFSVFFIKPSFSKQGSIPIKLGESLACGLPVIINSGIGDTAELVSRNGIGAVIDEFKAASYIKAVDEILELQSSIGDLRLRCRKVAEDHLSLGIGQKKYRDIYQRLSETKAVS
ncbi:MAG: glycosyltransferase [Candidatus Omnitrophota bacterium]